MFNVDHSGVSKPTHTQDVSPTSIEPQKLEEGPLEPEHTPQEPEVEMSTKHEPHAEAPQEAKSPDIEDLVGQETPTVKNNAGEESSEKPPVIDSQSPNKSPQPEPSADDNATKAQIQDAVSENGKAVDGKANKIENAPAPESQLHTSPTSTLHPTEDATADPANRTASDDGKLIDDTSSTEEDVSFTEDEKEHTIPSEQKDFGMPEPLVDAPVQTEEQKDENDAPVQTEEQKAETDAQANKENANEANAIAQDYFVPEEEGTGLGHVFPFLNPNYDPEQLENPSDPKSCGMEQKDNMTPEPSAHAPVLTEEWKDENNAEANMEKADEADAVPLESVVPEEESTGLLHVFPFANPKYEPESLENPHAPETCAEKQDDIVTPEAPADVSAKAKERDDQNNTSERNSSILANVNKTKAEDAKAVAQESFVPEEEGTGLGHVFPFLNPDYDPEPLENPHDAEAATKEGGETSKLNPVASSAINDEDPSNEMPNLERNEEEPKGLSNNETSTVETAQEDKHGDQGAPLEDEKNDKAEEVISSHNEREQTAMDAPQAEEQGADENDVATEAQAPAEIEDPKDAPTESASNPDTESIPGDANLEVEKPDGDNEAPTMETVPEGSGLHHVLPYRTRSTMEDTTADDTTTDHTDPGEVAQHDEDDLKNTEDIEEANSLSPSESPKSAKNSLAPVEHDTELEHTSPDSNEKKQDQHCLLSMKPEDAQHPTEERQEFSAIQPLGAVEEVSLSEPNRPDAANKDADSVASSGCSAYESFNDDDETSGEDNLISQAVSNLRHETLNDRLMDRLVEDPVRVGEIVAASTPTKEEEELKGGEELSSIPEDLALSDQDSIPELKLSEPVTSTDKDETLNKPHAIEVDNQISAAGGNPQHDKSHDRLACPLAEDPIGVSESMSAKSGGFSGTNVDLSASSVQAVISVDAPPTLISVTFDKTEEATCPDKDIQDHQQPAPALVLEIADEPKAKLPETTSPHLETEGPNELAATTPTDPTPTKSQQRRAQAKRAKERKAAEREAAASQNNEGASATSAASAASDGSEKHKFGKTNMTKRQIKRARQTRAKQRRMEAEKSSTQ